MKRIFVVDKWRKGLHPGNSVRVIIEQAFMCIYFRLTMILHKKIIFSVSPVTMPTKTLKEILVPITIHRELNLNDRTTHNNVVK